MTAARGLAMSAPESVCNPARKSARISTFTSGLIVGAGCSVDIFSTGSSVSAGCVTASPETLLVSTTSGVISAVGSKGMELIASISSAVSAFAGAMIASATTGCIRERRFNITVMGAVGCPPSGDSACAEAVTVSA